MTQHEKKSIQEIAESLDELWEYYVQNKEELLHDYITKHYTK